MIQPWQHAPMSHQLAFKSQFGSPMPPTSGFNAPAMGGSPIHEKVTPRHIGSQVHSAVKSPGISDTGGAPATPPNSGGNAGGGGAMGLGQM